MWQRLVHSEYFVALLAQPQRWRSAHFALHHVPAAPKPRRWARGHTATGEISTGSAEQLDGIVDNSRDPGHWWAAVVPKRHARRAVTRNLIERQVQAALLRQGQQMPAGQWLVRLRSPWAREQFRSADSPLLRAAVGAELDTLFTRCRSPRNS
jgi:ribonuclease P protein component